MIKAGYVFIIFAVFIQGEVEYLQLIGCSQAASQAGNPAEKIHHLSTMWPA
jgi:hypothetical protein